MQDNSDGQKRNLKTTNTKSLVWSKSKLWDTDFGYLYIVTLTYNKWPRVKVKHYSNTFVTYVISVF